MKRTVRYLLPLMLIAGIAVAGPSVTGDGDAIFQASTLAALSAGVLEGPMTFHELRERGDFGLGTLNGLDGEMIAVDGRFYQVNADGVASLIPDTQRTPFAVVKRFQADRTVTLSLAADMTQLTRLLDESLPSRNVLWAVRIEGRFRSILVRSVPRQTRPFPTLAQALLQQRTFTLSGVTGTLVGFRMPQYLQGVNVPGYHFHFLTADRQTGGHVLACDLEDGTATLDEARGLHMALPDDRDFDGATLSP